MANVIKPKRSYTATTVPTGLVAGEIAVNATDGKIWICNAAGTVNLLVSSLAIADHTGTLGVANGGTGVTTSTGSGANVLATSPTLVTPILGTPTSGTLTNCIFPIFNQNTTGLASSATNLAGGGAGQLPYNTASGATSFLAAGTASYHLRSNGSSAPTWEAQGVFSSGRLTIESGVPVSTTDQTAKTTVYFTPYNGNVISLYNGTSWVAYSFSEISLTTSGLAANSNYDIFAYVSGSTVTLEYSAAWTNDTTRSSAISLLNGVYVKTSDTTRRYLGTIRSNASTQLTDSLANRLVWNVNNQVHRPMFGVIYTSSHTYNGGAREWNGGTSITRLYFITGIKGGTFTASGFVPVASAGFSANAYFGVDSTTAQYGTGTTDDRANAFTRRSITSVGQVDAGYHYLTLIQSTESAGTATFYDPTCGGSLPC